VESITSKPFTTNQRGSSMSEQNKSALTDHASHDNHVTSWPATTILDRESDKRYTRWTKEAVHFRKERWRSLNQDEGSYTLHHTHDRFLATSHHYRGKNRKKNWSNFFWWMSPIETETSKVKNVGCVKLIVFFCNKQNLFSWHSAQVWSDSSSFFIWEMLTRYFRLCPTFYFWPTCF